MKFLSTETMETVLKNNPHTSTEGENPPTIAQHPCTEAIKIQYPTRATNEPACKKFKEELIKSNPETLYAECPKNGNANNFIFHTDNPKAWHTAIRAHYPSAKKEGFSGGWTLKINPDDEPTTIQLYKKGTVLIQGNLSLLEQDFSKIKERAQEEKAQPGDDPPTTSHLDTPPQNDATDEPHLMEMRWTSWK